MDRDVLLENIVNILKKMNDAYLVLNFFEQHIETKNGTYSGQYLFEEALKLVLTKE